MRIPGKITRRGSVLYFDGYAPAELVQGKKLPWERIRFSCLTTDPKVAVERAEEQYFILLEKRRLDAGPKPLLVHEFYQRFRTEWIIQQRNGAGVKMADQRFEQHIAPVIGALALEEVTPSDLRRLRNVLEAKQRGRTGRPLSPMTVRHVLGDVRCMFRFAVDECQLLDRSPVTRSLLPKITKSPVRPLSEEQERAILGVATVDEAFVIRIAILSGLRWGELRTLHRRDVHWEPRPHLVIDPGNDKTARGRIVPLVGEAEALIRTRLESSDSLMVSPFQAKNACWFVYRIAALVGFPWHFHMCRHTFVTRSQLQGYSPGWVGAVAGQTPGTVGNYTHVLVESLFGEVDRVDRRKTGAIEG